MGSVASRPYGGLRFDDDIQRWPACAAGIFGDEGSVQPQTDVHRAASTLSVMLLASQRRDSRLPGNTPRCLELAAILGAA